MTSGFSLIGVVLSFAYAGLAFAFAVFADRLYGSRPIGLWGDVAAAALAIAAFAIFLGDGWHRMLLELNDDYPAYFALAYMPIVAFVAIGFVRSLVPLIPARRAQTAPVMAMAASGQESPSAGTPDRSPASSAAVASAGPETGPAAKPPSGLMKWIKLAVGVILLIVIVLVGLARFLTRNELPGCGSQTARDLLSNIFQSKKIEVKRYDDIKTNSTTEAMVTCTAFMTMMNDHRAEIDYQITFLADKDVEVRITAGRDK